MKLSRLIVGGALGLVALGAARIVSNPLYQPLLAKASVKSAFDIPNTERTNNATLIVAPIADDRLTLEDSVARLIITRSHSTVEQNALQLFSSGSFSERVKQALGTDDAYTAGGFLLSKTQTRSNNVFGRYTSYNPRKTIEHVNDLRVLMAERGQRGLIVDEGEGGYTQRVGTLPPFRDIANYYDNNTVSASLHMVPARTSKNVRKREIRQLFNTYAREQRRAGVEMVLGPVLDLSSRTNNLIAINKDDRAPSPWALNTIDLAVEYVQAMHRQGIRVTAKHFPNIGSIKEDLHMNESCIATSDRSDVQKGAELYRRVNTLLASVGERIDAVLVSHAGNPNDTCAPYSLSSRTYDFLHQPLYAGETTKGLGMASTLAITDELSMASAQAGLARVPEQSRALVAHCSSDEGKVAALAIRAGADGVIQNGRIDPLVACITSTARSDPVLYERIQRAYAAWDRFSREEKQ